LTTEAEIEDFTMVQLEKSQDHIIHHMLLYSCSESGELMSYVSMFENEKG
jgi:hypothetical protein